MVSFAEFQYCSQDGSDESSIRDETLMERIGQRQQQALGQLYSRHRRTLRGVIIKVVGDESEADDILQESFLQVWYEPDKYSPDLGRPLGWIITIARRRAIDRVRRRDCYRRAKGRFEQYVRPEAASRTKTDSDLACADLRRFLERQLRILPDGQRKVLELAYLEGFSQRQIAAATGIPLGTIKTRFQLGMKRLAQCVIPLRQKI